MLGMVRVAPCSFPEQTSRLSLCQCMECWLAWLSSMPGTVRGAPCSFPKRSCWLNFGWRLGCSSACLATMPGTVRWAPCSFPSEPAGLTWYSAWIICWLTRLQWLDGLAGRHGVFQGARAGSTCYSAWVFCWLSCHHSWERPEFSLADLLV